MTDCRNADMRDRLPDLLHERLETELRAKVRAHVDACVPCQAELALLRDVRAALSRAPAIDVAAIARQVVVMSASHSVRPLRPRHTWSEWRIAAAIAALAVGGASLATIYGTSRAGEGRDSGHSAQSSTAAAVVGATTAARVAAPAAPVAEVAQLAELSMGGGVSDLSESDLRALLDDIESLDAVPVIEPEPVALRVAPLAPGSSE